jgi:hypothetical protein
VGYKEEMLVADFTVRVVLHGATSDQYQDLHDAMQNRHGALRQIQGDGVWYDLPDGEYAISSTQAPSALCSAVHATASSVKKTPSPSVLVTQSAGRSFVLRKVPGDS